MLVKFTCGNGMLCPQGVCILQGAGKADCKAGVLWTTGSGQASEGSQFISAVCWKPQAQTLLAANSQGCIKVMQLTS